MVHKYDWIKDALIPLVIGISLLVTIALGGEFSQSVQAAFEGGDEAWREKLFQMAWVSLLTLSCLSSGVGAILRHYRWTWYLFFEFPGVVGAFFFTMMYSIGVTAVNWGNSGVILAVGISTAIAIHFLFRAIALIATLRRDARLSREL